LLDYRVCKKKSEQLKFVIDDKIPFIRGAFEPVAMVCYQPGATTSNDDLLDVDALVTRTRTKCDFSLLEGSRVKFIASATIGFDHIDTGYCDSAGICWCNAPGCNSGAVLQYVLSVLFNLEKRYGFDLLTKKVGVVGVGHVGQKVVSALRALGVRVLLNDPPRSLIDNQEEFVSLDELLIESDIVCLHTPLLRDGDFPSYHLIGTPQLERFVTGKSSCYLINAGRGEVVDGDALKDMLSMESRLHVVLDVWENEPNIDKDLLHKLDFASCHTAGYSADGKANGTTASVQAISRWFNLGLDDWQATIPDEVDLEYVYDESLSILDNVRRLVLKSYDVGIDDRALRLNNEDFEFLRGNYRIRREPSKFNLVGKKSESFKEFVELVENAITF
jgi:erythronate-4-phosphate dehydrogenase